ncbi:hypothetical protein SMI01S_07510 [Sphingobacterium mizutaii NBRC 14946 = DSM 11724]|uniref:Uncharacterized protein n=1 Tax=Sphingobacterium mizutaii NBRC 14946 = DSM 11724 TaxID=1220576 RepID=A0ABQ0VZZ9_9SPHI|nr:hypothetical protein SMI01S_07510 [Sphingobacterium mizutaii NBRC 14946 = DSM 11724]
MIVDWKKIFMQFGDYGKGFNGKIDGTGWVVRFRFNVCEWWFTCGYISIRTTDPNRNINPTNVLLTKKGIPI